MKENGLINLWQLLLGLLFIVVLSQWGRAQAFSFTYFNQEDRLTSRNWKSSILEDDNGYLWMSSFRGLTRFDGHNFLTFHTGSNADIRIDFEDIGSLYKLGTGEFAYHKSGAVLGIFNPQNYTFRTVNFQEYTEDTPIIVSLSRVNDGELYICLEATSGIAVVGYDGKDITKIFTKEEERPDAIKSPLYSRPKLYITPFDENTYIFFDANKGYFFLDKEKSVLSPITLPPLLQRREVWPYIIFKHRNLGWLLSFTDVPGLFTFNKDRALVPYPGLSTNIVFKSYNQDKAGNILFFGNGGGYDRYFLWEQGAGTIEEIKDYFHTEGRSTDVIWSRDYTSYFFTASEQGLVYGRKPFYSITPLLVKAEKNKTGISMRGMIALKNGKILMGSDTDGLFLFDPEKDLVSAVSIPAHWPADLKPVSFSRNMLKDSKGVVWLTAYASTSPKVRPAGYVLKFDEAQMRLDTFYKVSSRVESMAFINDTLLLTGIENELSSINIGADFKMSTITDDVINWSAEIKIERVLPANEPDQFYILTDEGLFHYDFYQQALKQIPIKGSLVKRYLDLYLDEENILWIGTYADGLYKYDVQTEELTRFGFQQGIKSDIICGILPQGENHLLLSTYNGLYCFDKQTGLANSRSLTQGLMHYEFNKHSKLVLSNTSWLLGGMNGFAHVRQIINPKEVKSQPLVLITHLQFRHEASDRDTLILGLSDFKKGITLPADGRRLKLKLSSFDQENMVERQLYYRLFPVSKEWELLSDDGELNLNFIPPGHHEIQVVFEPGAEPAFILPVFARWKFFELVWVKSVGGLIATGILGMLFYLYFDRKLIHAKSRQLEENEKFRHRLFAYISHEFKTPLTIVFGLLNRLKSRLDDATLHHDMDLIERHGQTMTNLVNQMIELNELEANAWTPQYIATNIPEHLKLIVEQVRPLAESMGVNLQWTSTHEELVLMTDAEKLRVILNNLLNNAIKFSPSGEVVQVFFVANQAQWSLTVRDRGPGIEEADIAKIFDLFYQGNQQHEKEMPNSGIGLAYVKSVVEAMNGKLSVSNDQGAEFKVSFPAKQAVEQITDAKERPLFSKATVAVTEAEVIEDDRTIILLVEDTADLAAYIISCFSKDRYQLIWARDGDDGYEHAIQKVPDLIISDVMMPGRSGFELCETLKQHPATNHIPIVMLTALADNKSRLEGLKAQADVYLEKPFQEATLLLTVANLLNTRDKLAAYYATKSSETAPQSPTPALSAVQDDFIQKMLEALEHNATDPQFGVKELSSQLFLSRSQLHRKVKAILGKTPVDLIREHRLEKARLLLKRESISIEQIALESGFNDASYFSKVFIAEYGIAPSTYRKMGG